MQQVSQFLSGERDYTLIRGGTGPLVYPAVHVYIYSALYKLTSSGTDIVLAQCAFAVLYIATLCLVMACYVRAGAPPYILPLLVLSKRLHSIYVLRCFNDCFAVLFFWLAVLLLQRRMWTLGAVAYSLGIGVKMSLLLGLPAVGAVLFLARGLQPALRMGGTMLQVQVLVATPFLRGNWRGYLARAFELSRQFLYKWTVNWRFVSEETFLSRDFSSLLLALHAAVLGLFVTTRWLRPSGKSITAIASSLLYGKAPFTPAEMATISRRVTPNFVMTTVLSAMVVGMLFARSLHYQFYAYLAWASPFLLWRSGVHPVVQYAVWAAQEWTWNVAPSTANSSALLVSALAAQVALVWWGTRDTSEVKPGRARVVDAGADSEVVDGKSYAEAVKEVDTKSN
jgi:alpha-1,3-mannosyltransferase